MMKDLLKFESPHCLLVIGKITATLCSDFGIKLLLLILLGVDLLFNLVTLTADHGALDSPPLWTPLPQVSKTDFLKIDWY